jgi:hypothetical protein
MGGKSVTDDETALKYISQGNRQMATEESKKLLNSRRLWMHDRAYKLHSELIPGAEMTAIGTEIKKRNDAVTQRVPQEVLTAMQKSEEWVIAVKNLEMQKISESLMEISRGNISGSNLWANNKAVLEKFKGSSGSTYANLLSEMFRRCGDPNGYANGPGMASAENCYGMLEMASIVNKMKDSARALAARDDGFADSALTQWTGMSDEIRGVCDRLNDIGSRGNTPENQALLAQMRRLGPTIEDAIKAREKGFGNVQYEAAFKELNDMVSQVMKNGDKYGMTANETQFFQLRGEQTAQLAKSLREKYLAFDRDAKGHWNEAANWGSMYSKFFNLNANRSY